MKLHGIIAVVALFAVCPMIIGCGGPDLREEKMTVAKAQKEIKIGMSSSDVIEVMGSPNMITTDDQRRETWVYDRVSQQVSSGGAGVWLIIAGANSSHRSSSSRTLTVIVKFDENSKVRDFSYRSSSF
jgi:outer membrane protein assembly factor BamE (lipoprotein component of BamABCDE complex)